MAGWTRYGKEPLEITPLSEDGFGEGDLKGYGEANRVDRLLKLDCELLGTSTGVVAAPNAAQIAAILNTMTLDLRFDMGRRATATSEDEENIFHPLQSQPLTKVIRIGKRLVEKLPVGTATTDNTTGLGTAFVAGAFTRSFAFYVSVGIVEFVDEDEHLWGMGPEQLELMRLTMRLKSDGLAAYNAALSTDKLKVTVKAWRQECKGRRASLSPMLRRFTPGAQKRQVVSLGGIPLDAVDTTNKLATTAKGALTVEVGGKVVTDRPDTPEDVHDAYTTHPDTGAVEASIADEVTPIFEQADTSYSALNSGPLVATQETYVEPWELEVLSQPTMREQHAIQFIQRLSATGLKRGQAFHFMNTASAAKMTNLEGRLLPGTGLAYYLTSEPEAEEYPGLRCDADGNVDLYVPPDFLAMAAREYAQGEATGNLAKMDGAIHNVGRHVPGYVDDEVGGFPSSVQQAGAETNLYRQLRGMVQREAAKYRQA